MNDLDKMFYDRLNKMKHNHVYLIDLKKMDTALEKITLGLSYIYNGYENIPPEAMNLSVLGKTRDT